MGKAAAGLAAKPAARLLRRVPAVTVALPRHAEATAPLEMRRPHMGRMKSQRDAMWMEQGGRRPVCRTRKGPRPL